MNEIEVKILKNGCMILTGARTINKSIIDVTYQDLLTGNFEHRRHII